MTHRGAVRYLIDFAVGNLQRDLALKVQTHADACPDCRNWLDTYRVLRMAFEREETNVAGHLSAETLARFAIASDSLTREIEDSVNSHLEQCDQCAMEVDICRRAVDSANVAALHEVDPWEQVTALLNDEEEVGESRLPQIAKEVVPESSWWLRWQTPALRRKPSVWITVAASVVLGLAVSAVMQWSESPSHSSDTYVLTQRTLIGVTTIEASERIVASSLLVDRSANVTLRAKTVVLGDGFSVGSGASFRIESNSR